MQRLSVFGTMAAAILAAILAGCSPEQEQLLQEPRPSDTVGASEAFHAPEFPQGRSLDTILAIHFDGSGKAEYVVASLGPDSTRPAGARADLLQVYRFDSAAGSFKLLLADSSRWAVAYETRDLTGDGKPELIVRTDAGGNDDVATRGMRIFSGDRGTVRAIYETNRGAPILSSFDPGGEAVILHGKLWPPFASHVDAIAYVDDILAWRNGRFVSIRKEQSRHFRAIAEEHLKNYSELRTKFMADTVTAAPTTGTDTTVISDTADIADSVMMEPTHPLFGEAAMVILAFGRGDQARSLRSFWDSEKEYLRRRLPPDQYAELERLYGDMM